MTDDLYTLTDGSHRTESDSCIISSSIPTLMDEGDVPLRLIHGGTICGGPFDSLKRCLKLTEYRAEFWEAYAKEILSLHRKKKTEDSSSCMTKDALKDLNQKRYEDMNSQIRELVTHLEQLKCTQVKEREKSRQLQEELKKTERVKNSYKKQVKDLNVLLEEARYPVSSHSSSNKTTQDEMAVLQNKVTTMRLQMEGYKNQIDQERVERNLVQGKLDELQDRYKRREIALDRAQKRCRQLDSYAQMFKEQKAKGDDEDSNIIPHDDPVMESVVVTPATSFISTKEYSKQEEDKDVNDDSVPCEDIEETPQEGTLPSCPSVQDEQEDDASTDSRGDTNQHQEEDHGVALSPIPDENHVEEQPQTSEMSTAPRDYQYERIFGSMELVHAEHIIKMADNTLHQCMPKMKTLSKMLEASETELNNLKATCAHQYDQIFRYKNTCSTLKGKIQHLENHVARLQYSSGEYEAQMERLIEQQRQSAAEESHTLTAELQHMSQEQARLLLKLHAVEIDLDKSRAICRQLMRRVQILEQPKNQDTPASGSHPEDSCSNLPSPPCNTPEEATGENGSIVAKLQHIAQGLRGLSSPRMTS